MPLACWWQGTPAPHHTHRQTLEPSAPGGPLQHLQRSTSFASGNLSGCSVNTGVPMPLPPRPCRHSGQRSASYLQFLSTPPCTHCLANLPTLTKKNKQLSRIHPLLPASLPPSGPAPSSLTWASTALSPPCPPLPSLPHSAPATRASSTHQAWSCPRAFAQQFSPTPPGNNFTPDLHIIHSHFLLVFTERPPPQTGPALIP